MKIKIIAVGNLKDSFNRTAFAEYEKRIKRFASLEVKEITEERADSISEILKREGSKIEKEIEGALVVLDIQGMMLSSEQLSASIDKLFLSFPSITFVVGSSHGLADFIKNKAVLKLSFSKMTFPHGLFRVMLVEQLYRAISIKNNLPYHK